MILFSVNAKKLFCSTALLSALFVLSPVAYAQDEAKEACTNVTPLIDEGDLEGALEEARWCVTQLEQIKQTQTSSFFKDEINGYVAGELESQQVMGLSIINRTYTKGDNSVEISLSGAEPGAIGNTFAAIASFGMQAAQGKKIRIQRRTATVTNDGGASQVIITLKNGGMLTFDSRKLSEDELVAFAKAFPVAELDASRNL